MRTGARQTAQLMNFQISGRDCDLETLGAAWVFCSYWGGGWGGGCFGGVIASETGGRAIVRETRHQRRARPGDRDSPAYYMISLRGRLIPTMGNYESWDSASEASARHVFAAHRLMGVQGALDGKRSGRRRADRCCLPEVQARRRPSWRLRLWPDADEPIDGRARILIARRPITRTAPCCGRRDDRRGAWTNVGRTGPTRRNSAARNTLGRMRALLRFDGSFVRGRRGEGDAE